MGESGPDLASRPGNTVASTYPATDPSCQFEESLQTSLLQQRKQRDWTWLNWPITIWAGSAIFLGLLGYVFNTYPSCVSSTQVDSRQGSKLLHEISERRKRINSALCAMDDRRDAQATGPAPARAAEPDSPDLTPAILPCPDASVPYTLDELKTAVRIIDPKQTYIFSEMQGKKFSELLFELETILLRWNVIARGSTVTRPRTTEDFDRDSGNPPEFSMSHQYWVLAYYSFSASTEYERTSDLLDESRAFLADHWKMTDAEREESIKEMSKRFRLLALNWSPREDFDPFGEPSDTSAIISKGKCFQRLIWPF
jgi:hypothetical protein